MICHLITSMSGKVGLGGGGLFFNHNPELPHNSIKVSEAKMNQVQQQLIFIVSNSSINVFLSLSLLMCAECDFKTGNSVGFLFFIFMFNRFKIICTSRTITFFFL